MAVIKTVGQSGQIALGKAYAGRHVLMDELEPGVAREAGRVHSR